MLTIELSVTPHFCTIACRIRYLLNDAGDSCNSAYCLRELQRLVVLNHLVLLSPPLMSTQQKISSLFVTNKYGGLIFTKHFYARNTSNQPSENVYMTLLSTMHSLHLMAQQIAPNPSDYQYMENIVMGDTIICTHQTATGVKFVIVVEGGNATDVPQRDQIMSEIYELYVEYVVKNPFYVDEHPFQNNCKEFVDRVTRMIEERNGTA